MFNENLATLKSPDRQAKCMRIQFEIKEKLPDIISEILHSDKWLTLVRDENHGLRRVTIKDPYFDSEACVDIWEHEIHVTTAWYNYTYRIYQKGFVPTILYKRQCSRTKQTYLFDRFDRCS